MLQSLSNIVLESRALQVLLGVIVLLVIVGVVFGLYRLIFAHRLRVPGASRGRAPRLGVVDVFSLDGQRQLVIVRRDNVEHLLMIGGPNDIVVEPQILRSAVNGASSREAVKPQSPSEPPVEAATMAAPRPVAPAASARRAPFRPATPVAEPPPLAAAASVELPPVALETPAAEPRIRPLPTTPARSEAPAKPPEFAPPPRPPEPFAAPEPKPAAESLPPRKPLAPPKPATVALRPNLPSPITPLRPRNPEPAPAVEPPRTVAAMDPVKAPDVVIAPPSPDQSASAPAVIVPPPVPSAGQPPRARADDNFYDLESLEAEMARLLGRDG
jgi:hypothetical protein